MLQEVRSVVVERLWPMPAVGFGFVAAYGASENWSVALVGVAVASATLLVGALLGFLFGIPRVLAADTPQPPGPINQYAPKYGANTNLEQISDWLTKLLIGAGLAQFGELRSSMNDLIVYIAPALGDDQTAKVFALALILYFLVCGFLCAYLITRLNLRKEFEEFERGGAGAEGG